MKDGLRWLMLKAHTGGQLEATFPSHGRNKKASSSMLDYTLEKYVCQAESCKIIKNFDEAMEALNALDPEEVYALDFETTALRPAEGFVRLTTIVGDGVAFIIDHWFAGSFPLFAELLSQRQWAVFNNLFEGDWIDYYSGNDNVVLYDIQHMKKAKMGGGPSSLAKMAKADLKYEMDKTEQNSAWGNKELTHEQLVYAAIDGFVTWDLWLYWLDELTDEQWQGFLIINEAWRGTLEMEYNALHVDVDYHETIIKLWKTKHSTAERYIRKLTPPNIIENIRSRKQLSDFFKRELGKETILAWPKTGKTEQLSTESKLLKQMAYKLPYPFRRWMAALVIFNYYEKYLSTYGEKLIWHMKNKGYIPTRFNMAAAITCRYSSSAENLQNIPRSPVVRRSFTTLPLNGDLTYDDMKRIIKHYIETGEVLEDIVVMVMADYSSIEVRVLAELSGDKNLLHDAIYGDVHSRSASQIFGIDYDYFKEVIDSDGEGKYANVYAAFKDMRSRAKSFTFQLLYGAGAAALAIVLRCSEEEAAEAIEAWGKLYPKAYGYRTYMFEIMVATGFLPVCDGRTIHVYKQDRTMPVAANYPVQGAAASVMYRAITHVGNWVRHCNLPVQMTATVHDELILYSRLSAAKKAKAALEKNMVQGWLDIFPNTDIKGVVDGVIGASWGDKK